MHSERRMYMASSNKNKHLTREERIIIETGIRNGSSKKSIADTLGKDKSTIAKEIKLHRIQANKMNLALECTNYKTCKLGRHCKTACSNYMPFKKEVEVLLTDRGSEFTMAEEIEKREDG